MYSTLLELAKDHFMWPDPTEAFIQGMKLPYIEHIANVASRVTKTWYPVVGVVSDPTIMEWHDNIVLKRNFSDTGEHVIHRGTENRVDTIVTKVNETKKNYMDLEVLGHRLSPTWFAMPYVSLLCDIGETRVFFFRGIIRYIMFTKQLNIDPDNWDVDEAKYVTPIELIS